MRLFKILLLTIFILNTGYSQWQQLWSSPSISDAVLSGYLSFENQEGNWKNRMYLLDAEKFQIMNDGLNLTPQYTYNFTPEEIAAGYQLYSVANDLNGDGITEFYVLAYHGESQRQSFKIFDITTGNILFEKNDASFSFSYPTLLDADNNSVLDCIVIKYDFPFNNQYYYEVYSTGVTSNGNDKILTPQFKLSQNFPNPFNPTTTINFSLENESTISIDIYNVTGEKVKTLFNGIEKAGSHSIEWNGADNFGNKLPTGVYFYRLNSKDFSETKKLIILK